jgi:hypothetical protein
VPAKASSLVLHHIGEHRLSAAHLLLEPAADTSSPEALSSAASRFAVRTWPVSDKEAGLMAGLMVGRKQYQYAEGWETAGGFLM